MDVTSIRGQNVDAIDAIETLVRVQADAADDRITGVSDQRRPAHEASAAAVPRRRGEVCQCSVT
jgi:hypothetical protein